MMLPSNMLRTTALLATVSVASLLATAAAPRPVDAERKDGGVKGAPLPSSLAKPKVYVFPMKGQMGTDISPNLVKVMSDDIKKANPDLIVFQLNAADIDTVKYMNLENPYEAGLMPEIQTYLEMLRELRSGELGRIPQVMWIEDALGISSCFSIGWPEMYMKSGARVGGLFAFRQMIEKNFEGADADVQGKMREAWTGKMQACGVIGGYPSELYDAMIFEENKLSAKFEGRETKWLGDDSGQFILDGSDKIPVVFDAQKAEDFMFSDGTADSLEDLMFLLGYREFENVGKGPQVAQQFTDDWRRAMDKVLDNMAEAEQVEGTVAGLGKAKRLYEDCITLMKRYPFMEKRRDMQEAGVNVTQFLVIVDQLKKDIQRAKEAERNGGQSGGGSGGGGLRGGGGMRGR